MQESISFKHEPASEPLLEAESLDQRGALPRLLVPRFAFPEFRLQASGFRI